MGRFSAKNEKRKRRKGEGQSVATNYTEKGARGGKVYGKECSFRAESSLFSHWHVLLDLHAIYQLICSMRHCLWTEIILDSIKSKKVREEHANKAQVRTRSVEVSRGRLR